MEIKVLDKGFVRLIDWMGDDSAIVQAARVSYGAGTKTKREDAGLINYLWQHQHLSPFEMVEIKLHVKLPIFIARQWIRHRTANVNEYSGRYSIMKPEFYIPEKLLKQSSDNKQCSSTEEIENASQYIQAIENQCNTSYKLYEEMLNKGVSREIARIILPLNTYCVHIDTPILTERLDWVSAKTLSNGDRLLAFEEYPMRGKGSPRRIIPAIVENFQIKNDDLYEITLSNGDMLKCNLEHRWLIHYKSGKRREWVSTREIMKNPNVWLFTKTFNTWKIENTYDWGFLSAAFDGEGFITRTTGNGKAMGFVQKNNAFLIKIREILKNNKINFSEYTSADNCITLNIRGGFGKILEIMGRAQPPRLMNNWVSNISGGLFPIETPSIIAIKHVGTGRIASFSTTSKTYFANGYPCHNTEWYWKIDLRNLFNFLKLRLDPTASMEIQEYARAISEIVKARCPLAYEAFEKK